MERLLRSLIANPKKHVKWLNTLSYLENAGARKIAKAEHPTLVKQEMLKHAAEEFRHAHYLKQQIGKLTSSPPADYSDLLGGHLTRRYLDRLELGVCRLTTIKLYPLVTYAIEKRAQQLYPLYQKALKESGSKVTVMSIIKEEEGHLEEMELELGECLYKEHVCEIEEKIYQSWIAKVELDF
ncbi:MAG: hypothetical protein S4CHLAM2_08970 [Chlamydiales bacterium]|nr:hypothetical protein [Chlamydiales bacterium]